MTAEIALLRLYLADPAGAKEVFTDEQLQTLLDNNDNDVYAGAADGWRAKAATVADWYQVSLDGSFLGRDQVWEHCMRMAEHFEKSGGGQLTNVKMSSTFLDGVENQSSEF